MDVVHLPYLPTPRRTPLVPEELSQQRAFGPDEPDDLEELIQTITSSQGFDAIMGVIDSLISTIERQEIIIWSLAKLLEEKGLINREELLKKIEELNKKRTTYRADTD